ncbi:hypothetical protein AB4222_20000 [Vibrio splendidus]
MKKVRIISFHGLKKEKKHEAELGTYWDLIDLCGTIVSPKPRIHPAYPEKGYQVLVQFDTQLSSIGIDSHNDAPNSLWIFESDLKVL